MNRTSLFRSIYTKQFTLSWLSLSGGSSRWWFTIFDNGLWDTYQTRLVSPVACRGNALAHRANATSLRCRRLACQVLSHRKTSCRRTCDSALVASVFVRTATHAEDMLTLDVLDSLGTQLTLLEVIKQWFAFVRDSASAAQWQSSTPCRADFDKTFTNKLRKDSLLESHLYPQEDITWISSPTYLDGNTNMWVSAADCNHSFLTVHSSLIGTNSSQGQYREKEYTGNMRTFVTLGAPMSGASMPGAPHSSSSSWAERFRFGFSHDQPLQPNSKGTSEGYVSLYYPVGHSLLFLRRLTAIQGLNAAAPRTLFALDWGVLSLLDVQTTVGKFSADSLWDVHLALELPLISNAVLNYYLGLRYCGFLTQHLPAESARHHLQIVASFGHLWSNIGSRLQATLQYDQSLSAAAETAQRRLSIGLSLYFGERSGVGW